MITKNHSSLYVDLFEMANKQLGLSGTEEEIKTIDDYFSHIGDLIIDEKSDPLFAILPADEELFEIDANKRKITVPASFSGGASVIGDEMAETIYFSIDRYFDTTDFASDWLTPIVQWEITVNGKKTQGYSATTPRTIGFVPDKVVFGWPLSQEITQSAGNVIFSVRFYEIAEDYDENGNEIQDSKILRYSFSTQPATIKINNSLVLDLIDGDIEKTDKLNLWYGRVRSSAPLNPVFRAIMPILDLAPYAAGYPKFGGEYNLEDGKLLLVAKAEYPHETPFSQLGGLNGNAGEQIYTWYRRNASGEKIEVEGDLVPIYVKTNDTTANSTEEYCLEDGSLYDYDAGNFDPSIAYEKAYGLWVDKGGDYSLTISNVIKPDSNEKVLEVPGFITIPLPKLVTFDGNEEKNYHAIIENGFATLTLNVNNPDGDTSIMKFQWLDENDNPLADLSEELEYSVSNEGAYRLKVVNIKNNDDSAISISESIKVTEPASVPEVSNYYVGLRSINVNEKGQIDLYLSDEYISITLKTLENSDNIQYQWYKNDKIISGATQDYYNLEEIAAGDKFHCEITNIYNFISEETTKTPYFVVVVE